MADITLPIDGSAAIPVTYKDQADNPIAAPATVVATSSDAGQVTPTLNADGSILTIDSTINSAAGNTPVITLTDSATSVVLGTFVVSLAVPQVAKAVFDFANAVFGPRV